MTTASNRKQKIKELKHTCKTLAADGVACRKKINESSGRDRYQAWDQKRAVGRKARIHYIAYGLLRGVDYATIESNVDDQGNCYAVPFRAAQVVKVLQEYCIEVERDHWTKEHVEKLLRGQTESVTRTEVRSNG